MQLCDLSAVEIRDHISSKQASAVEVLESCLQRIRQVDGRPGELGSSPETKEDAERAELVQYLPARTEQEGSKKGF